MPDLGAHEIKSSFFSQANPTIQPLQTMSGAQNGEPPPQGEQSQVHDVRPTEGSTSELTSSSSDINWETASEDDQGQEKAAALEASSRQAAVSPPISLARAPIL